MKKTLLISIITTLTLSAAVLNAQGINAEDTVSFQDFLQQFPTKSLPYTISEQDLQGQLENGTPRAKRLDWEFYQFLPTLERSAQVARMTVYPEPVASFETKEHFAVLYNLARGLSKGNKCYEIAVFDKEGNFIATRVIAGVNVKSLTSVTIDTELSATVKAYKVDWVAETKHVASLATRDVQTLDLTVALHEAEWNNSVLSQALTMPGATASNQK